MSASYALEPLHLRQAPAPVPTQARQIRLNLGLVPKAAEAHVSHAPPPLARHASTCCAAITPALLFLFGSPAANVRALPRRAASWICTDATVTVALLLTCCCCYCCRVLLLRRRRRKRAAAALPIATAAATYRCYVLLLPHLLLLLACCCCCPMFYCCVRVARRQGQPRVTAGPSPTAAPVIILLVRLLACCCCVSPHISFCSARLRAPRRGLPHPERVLPRKRRLTLADPLDCGRAACLRGCPKAKGEARNCRFLP